jgi:hypothetical protein
MLASISVFSCPTEVNASDFAQHIVHSFPEKRIIPYHLANVKTEIVAS